MKNLNKHTVVYLRVSKPGGQDGGDFSDKGGIVTGAFVDETDAQCPWSTVRPEAVDLDSVRKDAIAKLSPLERLALGLTPEPVASRR